MRQAGGGRAEPLDARGRQGLESTDLSYCLPVLLAMVDEN